MARRFDTGERDLLADRPVDGVELRALFVSPTAQMTASMGAGGKKTASKPKAARGANALVLDPLEQRVAHHHVARVVLLDLRVPFIIVTHRVAHDRLTPGGLQWATTTLYMAAGARLRQRAPRLRCDRPPLWATRVARGSAPLPFLPTTTPTETRSGVDTNPRAPMTHARACIAAARQRSSLTLLLEPITLA